MICESDWPFADELDAEVIQVTSQEFVVFFVFFMMSSLTQLTGQNLRLEAVARVWVEGEDLPSEHMHPNHMQFIPRVFPTMSV